MSKVGPQAVRVNAHFDISDCEFFSPSTVKGDAPVSSSYVSTPRDHQSTACEKISIRIS